MHTSVANKFLKRAQAVVKQGLIRNLSPGLFKGERQSVVHGLRLDRATHGHASKAMLCFERPYVVVFGVVWPKFDAI
jgi:hypothetical protein